MQKTAFRAFCKYKNQQKADSLLKLNKIKCCVWKSFRKSP